MKILTFVGSSPSEALKKAKAHPLYDDMIHIDTKELQRKTLTKDAIYEIIMGIESQAKEHSTYENIKNQTKPLRQSSEDVLFDISNAASQISKIAQTKEPLFDFSTKEKQVEPLDLSEIKNEILKLNDKVKLIQNMFWEDKSSTISQNLPPEFAEIYRLAMQSGMKSDHLDAIMSLTLEHMPSDMRSSSQTIKKYFQTLLKKMINIKVEDTPSMGEKRVIMLVGPTGVGKTTSVAKLAARYSYLLDKKYKVGLVVLDTFRIGAVEQLMQYARMMKLGIETVINPPEFESAIESLRYCDYILIDTMGSSPYDKKKIDKIYECLNGNSQKYNIDVTLVMPSSIKYEDLLSTYESFSYLGIDNIVFTKLDETKAFGNIFSFLQEVRKPLSYLSVGQEVPEDLVCASSDFLVECLLHGFDRSRA